MKRAVTPFKLLSRHEEDCRCRQLKCRPCYLTHSFDALILAAYGILRNLIEQHPCLDKPDIGWDDPGWAVFMGWVTLEWRSSISRSIPVGCELGLQ
jgi:hypothetical protein